MSTHFDAATVRQAAQGRWPHILSSLGISVPDHPKKHGPCPACGGRDRFKLDDRDGHGSFFCNQCPVKSGDGLALVRRCLRLSFPETLKTVGGVLGLDPSLSAKPRHPVPRLPARIEWHTLAFRAELAALDRRLRASRVLTAIPHLTGDELSAEVRDRLMETVASAHADVGQAERLEHLADLLRAKDFWERNRR